MKAIWIATVVATLALAARAGAQPAVVGSVAFPAREPLALAVYESGGKLFVTEDDEGRLHIFDAATLAPQATVTVGGSAYDMVVNESEGKVYVASNQNPGTTGANSGTGLISVIDADTNQLIRTFNPGSHTGPSRFELVNDEVHDKVYVAFVDGIGVIDATSDADGAYTRLLDLQTANMAPSRFVVNTATNRAYVDYLAQNELKIVSGATGAVTTYELDVTGAKSPLDVAVNEVENKLYVTMVLVPGQGEIGILILDLDVEPFGYKFVGAEDLEPLAFNPASNRLFTGVQVGQLAAIVDGATDALTPVDLEGAGIGASAVRSSTDNAYHANDEATFVVSGATRCVLRLRTGIDSGGGLVQTDLAVDQSTGRVYVTNYQGQGRVTAIQDGTVPCDEDPPETTITAGPSGEVTGQIAAFTFVSDEPQSTFECRLDASAFAPCTSPYVTETLVHGAHSFAVRAIDKRGNVDPTPAMREFAIVQPGGSTPPPAPGGGLPPFPSFPGFPGFPTFPAPATSIDLTVEAAVSASRSQRALRQGGVLVSVECRESLCNAAASGHVSVPAPPRRAAAARRFTLRRARASLSAGQRARLRLGLTKQLTRAVRAALRDPRTRGRVKARVTVRIVDAQENEATKTLTIKLTR